MAKAYGIRLCDANALMSREIAGLSEEEAFKLLCKDNWHVNSLGHRIYADTVFDELIKNKYI